MKEIKSLADLSLLDKAVVTDVAVTGTIRRRLKDIGLIEGTKVECVLISPLGDPKAFLIRGAVIALRSEDASQVLVKKEK